MSLLDHAKAARILAEHLVAQSMLAESDLVTEMLARIGQAHDQAALRMEQIVRDEAQAQSTAAACSFDHRSVKGPTCPACKALTK